MNKDMYHIHGLDDSTKISIVFKFIFSFNKIAIEMLMKLFYSYIDYCEIYIERQRD